jgi:Leucine-rich repeat (LRR) protein
MWRALAARSQVTQDGLLAKEVGPSITEVVVTHPQPQLGYFPPTLTSWPNLTTIDLTGNRIIYIPATIANLQQLKVGALTLQHRSWTGGAGLSPQT